MNKEEVARLTKEYGGDWGLNHARRLLRLVSIISADLEYNADVIWLAAHLHDWGAYPHWAVPGIDHSERSMRVAEDYMTQNDYPADTIKRVLECIQYHHGGDYHRSYESKIFTDADALDLLGAIGTMRIAAMNPRDLKAGYAAVSDWKQKSLNAIRTESAQKIAKRRVEVMDYILEMCEEESFGYM